MSETQPIHLLALYERLYRAYGPQHWWPADSKIEIVLGAILTQATSWTNVERALNNLKEASCLSTASLRDIKEDELALIIYPSGYFNSKAKKLKAFIHYLWRHHNGDLEAMLSTSNSQLRQELLTIYGIGEETADDIVLYAAGQPWFVIDTYTRRILGRLRIKPESESYVSYQQMFHDALPREVELFSEYHALLDQHAKETCLKKPLCTGCCLLSICPTGQAKPIN